MLDLRSGEVLRIADSGADPFYSTTGHIVFARPNALFAVPFDADGFKVAGPEMPVLQGVRVENAGALQAVTTDAGMLVYAPAGATVGTRLTWVDRQGKREPIGDQWRLFMAPRVSPGGERIAVVVNDGGKPEIWLVDVGSGGMVPLTASGAATAPVWTPDGKRVTYAEGATRPYSIRSISAAGGGGEEIVLTGDQPIRPEAWHPDGNFLVYTETRENDDLFLFDVAASSSTPRHHGRQGLLGGFFSGRHETRLFLQKNGDRRGVPAFLSRPGSGNTGLGRGRPWGDVERRRLRTVLPRRATVHRRLDRRAACDRS